LGTITSVVVSLVTTQAKHAHEKGQFALHNESVVVVVVVMVEAEAGERMSEDIKGCTRTSTQVHRLSGRRTRTIALEYKYTQFTDPICFGLHLFEGRLPQTRGHTY
jgi:hypothetical protein